MATDPDLKHSWTNSGSDSTTEGGTALGTWNSPGGTRTLLRIRESHAVHGIRGCFMNRVLMPATQTPPSNAHASPQASQEDCRSGSRDSHLAEHRPEELVKTAQTAARFTWEKTLHEEPRVGGLTPATAAVVLTLTTIATAVTGVGRVHHRRP